MGFLSDKLVAKLGDHSIEVRADNHLLRGLTYKMFIDGEEVSDAQNFLKIPTKRSLEAKVTMDGTERHIVVAVSQRMLSTDFTLTVDGEELTLERVE